VRFQDQRYYQHPVDRDYARSQLSVGSPGDSPAAFTLRGLQARAADYYAHIRTPQQSWRTLDDLRPQLAEFELRCDTGDYDTAAALLAAIDFGYLQVWGHYRTLTDLHERIHGRISDPVLNGAHLANLGNCFYSLGDYRQAIDLHSQALVIARDTRDPHGEGAELGNLGNCYYSLGDYRQAIDLHSQALVIARDIGDRRGEGVELGNLGSCRYSLGDFRRAIELYTQALAITRDTGTRQVEGSQLGSLGLCHYNLGDFRRAINMHNQALAIARDTGDRQLESHEQDSLGLCCYSLGDYRQAIDLHSQALAIARHIRDPNGEANSLDYLGRSWLALGDARRAVTLFEQAVRIADTTGDIDPAVKARSWLARARLQVADPAGALAAAAGRRELLHPTEEPTRRLLEGLALLELRRVEESVRAFTDALTGAGALLELADRNVAALQVRALTLTGLAVAIGDPARAGEAGKAFDRAHAVTTAAGVAEDTHRLLNIIVRQDRFEILARVRVALGL